MMRVRGPLTVAGAAGSMSTFLWRAAHPLALASLYSDFVVGLASGTLPKASFATYSAQDNAFLGAFVRAYEKCASLIPSHDTEATARMQRLIIGAKEEWETVRKAAGDRAENVEVLLATEEYTSFLDAAAAAGGVAEIMAATAPCMRLYAFLGQRMAAALGGESLDQHPYGEWLASYSNTDFALLVADQEWLLDYFYAKDQQAGGVRAATQAGTVAALYHHAMLLECRFFNQVPGVPSWREASGAGTGGQVMSRALVVDFDGTITQEDTTPLELAVAPADKATIAALKADYAAGASAAYPALPDTAASTWDGGVALTKHLEHAAAFERVAYAKLAAAMTGTPRAALTQAGADVPLRRGALRCLAAARAAGNSVHVATLNVSCSFVAAALSRDPEGGGGGAGLDAIYSSELEFGSDGTASGKLEGAALATGSDKAAAVASALGGAPFLYVGDSPGDLPALLSSELGVVVGGSGSLRSTAKAFGLKIVPLEAAALAQVREGGASRGTTRDTGILYEAASWGDIEALLFPGTGIGDAPLSTGFAEAFRALPPAPRVLIAAGSDSGGGAGIQADIKASLANGAFAMTAIGALTAQNTYGVTGVHVPPLSFFEEQMDTTLRDIGADAIKTGMLPSADQAAAVAERAARSGAALVVDPVMIAASGASLVASGSVRESARALFPMADVITPNLPEAAALLQCAIPEDLPAMHAVARGLYERFGPRAVLLKGGHLPGVSGAGEGAKEAVDVLFDGEVAFELYGPRVPTRNAHGTGCTLASSIASHLARGTGLLGAVVASKRYLSGALASSAALQIGTGPSGPLNHAYRLGAWPVRAKTVATDALGLAEAPRAEFDLSVYAVTDSAMNEAAGRTMEQVVKDAIRGGATIIQIREKGVSTKEFVDIANQAVAAACGTGVAIIINDRLDVALASNAHGLHVGQDDMDATTARRILGPDKILGVSCKTPAEARLAEKAGADYIGSGAVCGTSTKDTTAIGIEGVAACVAAVRIPCVAIGGVKAEHCPALFGQAKCAGIAVVSAIFAQPDVEAATRSLADAVAAAKAGMTQ